MHNYSFPKFKYTKNGIHCMYLFFDNGDFVEVKGSEIYNLSINVYDKLIRSNNGFNPFIESGFIKLKICKKHVFQNSTRFLYNDKEFAKDRKAYIENRCLNENSINKIWIFDSFNWHKVLHCQAKASMNGEFLMLEFLPNPLMESCKSENHSVNIGNLQKNSICKINLDFENCESFEVYQDEIKEINLSFDNQLEWGSSDLYRKIVGGYLKIKLNKEYTQRENNLFDNEKKLKIIDFEKRLCGKNGESVHDICHLYVNFFHAGYGEQLTVCIEIDEIREFEEVQKIEKKQDKEYLDFFQGGYCKKLKDGSIIISFGKNAKKTSTSFN